MKSNKKGYNRFKLNINNIDLNKQPKPSSMKRVTSISRSEDYDIAKTEWQYIDLILEDAETFTNVCGLCGNPHLKANFVVGNPHTGALLHVGSTCIITFGLIEGNIDAVSGVTMINNFVTEKELLDEIRGLTKSVMVRTPEYSLLNSFLKAIHRYFQIKGIKNPTINQLGETAYGSRWSEYSGNTYEPNWLYTVYYHPYSIETVKTKKVSKLPVYKEGTTWGHKRRKGAFITDSFGRSAEYNVQKYVNDKKQFLRIYLKRWL